MRKEKSSLVCIVTGLVEKVSRRRRIQFPLDVIRQIEHATCGAIFNLKSLNLIIVRDAFNLKDAHSVVYVACLCGMRACGCLVTCFVVQQILMQSIVD